MTTGEIQALRDAAYTQYLAWVNAGCPESYQINGRSVTRADMDKLLDRIQQWDAQVGRASSGGAFVARFRDSE